MYHLSFVKVYCIQPNLCLIFKLLTMQEYVVQQAMNPHYYYSLRIFPTLYESQLPFNPILLFIKVKSLMT